MSVEIGNLVTRFSGDTRDLDQAFQSAEAKTHAFVGNANKALSGLSSVSSLLTGAVGGFAASLGLEAIGSFKDASAAVIQYSANLEQTRIAFNTLLGSASAAESHLRALQKFAAETPFEFAELTQSSRRIQAMGIEATKVIPLLTAIGDSVAAIGGNSETINRVTLAISQMSAKGRTQNEELLQIAETGIPAYELLAKHIGKTTGEVSKLAEQGKISADVFIAAFQEFSQQNFGGAMEKQSHTFLGAFSTIKDTVLQLSASAFEPMFKDIASITDRIATAIKDADNLSDLFNKTGKELGRTFAEGFSKEFLNKNYIGEANQLSEDFGAALESAIDGFSEQLVEEIVRGIGVAEEQYKTISISPLKLDGILPDLDVGALSSFRFNIQQLADESQRLDKVKDIFRDLGNQYTNFGDKSEVTATKQKLLAAGVDDMNSSLARQAIALATAIDKTNEWKRTLDVFDSLVSKISQFTGESFEATAQAQLLKDGIDLSAPLAQSTLSMARWLDSVKAQASAVDDLTKMKEQVTDFYGSIIRSAVRAFDTSKLAEFVTFISEMRAKALTQGIDFDSIVPKNILDAMTKNVAQADAQLKLFNENREKESKENALKGYFESGMKSLSQFNKVLKDELDGVDKFSADLSAKINDIFKGSRSYSFAPVIKLFESGTTDDLLKASALVSTIAEGIADSFGIIGTNAEENQKKVQALGDALFAFINRSIKKRDDDKEADALKQFTSLSEQLTDTLNKDVEVTERAKLEKTLLGEAYKYLTEAQRAYLLGLAEEIDKQEEWSRSFAGKFDSFKKSVPTLGDGLEDSFLNSLNAISDSLGRNLTDWRQGFSGMFKGIVNDFANMAREIAAYMIKLIIIQSLLKLFGGFLGGGAGGGTASGAPVGLGTGAITPPFAHGGETPGGMIWAGEHGPEPIFAPKGSRVLSHEDAMRALGKKDNQERGGDTYNIHVSVQMPRGSSQAPPSERQIAERVVHGLAARSRK